MAGSYQCIGGSHWRPAGWGHSRQVHSFMTTAIPITDVKPFILSCVQYVAIDSIQTEGAVSNFKEATFV